MSCYAFVSAFPGRMPLAGFDGHRLDTCGFQN